jgi:hypothetical protein
MSKEKSPFQILFPFITITGLGVGIVALNSLRSVKGDFFEMRGFFRDSILPETNVEQKKSKSSGRNPTLEQFRNLSDLGNFNNKN